MQKGKIEKGIDKNFLLQKICEELKKKNFINARKLAKEIDVHYFTLSNQLKKLENEKILIKIEIGMAGPCKRCLWIRNASSETM